MRALILGGTAESRELALLLLQSGWRVTSSLAGRVKEPKLPLGEVRIGGFGGAEGGGVVAAEAGEGNRVSGGRGALDDIGKIA